MQTENPKNTLHFQRDQVRFVPIMNSIPFKSNSGYSRWFGIVPAHLMKTIKIRGARTHNLDNIDLDLPRDKLIVVTGLSGSGKSSLAFDTIYAEGQRRYVESLSAYARQFLSMM